MMASPRTPPRLALAGVLALLLVPAAAAPQQGERVLDHDAYDIWQTIDGERISEDGRWVLYELALRVGDGELVVRRPTADEYRVPRAGNARFTADSRHAVFTIRPAHDSVRVLKLADTEPDDLPEDTLGILDLATGRVTRVPGVKSWKLPERAGGPVAYTLEATPPEAPRDSATGAPAGPPAAGGATADSARAGRDTTETGTLVLRELSTGAERRFPNVAAYALSQDGRWLAYTAAGSGGSDGVYLVETAAARERPLLTGTGSYKQLAFAEDGRQLAFVTDRDDPAADQPAFSLYHWREGRDQARRVEVSPGNGIPSGWWVSEHGRLRFSESGDRLFFGSAPRPTPEADADTLLEEERVRLDVWHWQDDYLQPMQLVNAEEERRRTYEAVVHLDRRDRVVQLETETMPSVTVGSEGNADVALAETNVPYRHLVGIESPGFSDVWLVDVLTGERERVLRERQLWAHLSPEARYLAWYDFADRHWHAMDVEDRREINLSAGIPVPVWDEQDDHPSPPGPYGTAGWTADDDELLIYDRLDIWAVDPDGRTTPRRITEGYGREHGLRLRHVQLDPEARWIDPDSALVLSAFDVRTRASGYYRDRVSGSGAPARLVLAPKRFDDLVKAADARVVMYTREDVTEFPDLWVSDAEFRTPTRVSDANPQQSEYNWATVELVDWLSNEGVRLEGLLYRPENFDAARRYPMMVYFYERNSDNLHEHSPPLPHRSVIRPTFYASRGYAVFVPDIVYQDGYPGESAMDAVMPGVLKLAGEPWIDETNVGVQGHSWGGYQIAYMLTQTDFFKAAEAGAPVANMTSAYGGIRWGSGMSRMFQYERTQSRIGGTLWEEPIRFLENSPLFFLDKVETPLLIMHNDEDGAVPWSQGIELFVGLRRLGKPAWMIVYNEEPHWPTTAANIRDWNIRMQQFFDHYLKGAPAPRWLVEGIPATAKGRTLGLELVQPAVVAEEADPRSGGGGS